MLRSHCSNLRGNDISYNRRTDHGYLSLCFRLRHTRWRSGYGSVVQIWHLLHKKGQVNHAKRTRKTWRFHYIQM